jgi:hypothetical protein
MISLEPSHTRRPHRSHTTQRRHDYSRPHKNILDENVTKGARASSRAASRASSSG